MFKCRGSLQSNTAVPCKGFLLRRLVRPLQIPPEEQGAPWGFGNETTTIDSGLDEPLAYKIGELRVRRISRTCRDRIIAHGPPSALGLSHSLGHKLGATYGIPHGITSVSETDS